MFSDIQNFTETTEEMEPEDLTYILNNYLTEMSNIALKYGATIDKFIGDAIVAFFGDPESMGVKEDAVACVLMAIEMKNKLKELQHKWHTEGFVRPFSARIGINTGYVTVGNFGSEQKMEYTAIGGNMNLAARLEASATAGEILISHETYLLVRDKILTTYMGDVKAKGINKPIRTYQVIQAENRNSLSAKSDGFFINIDYAAIKDTEKENIVEVLDSVKRSLLNSQETYFDESSHHDEITKVSINVYDEDYEDSISKPLIVESKSKVERIPANEETKQEKVEFNNDLKESESKEEEPHHNLKEPESKVERILPNESEENKE
jgi:class 3 adenylate cyclase